MHDKLRTAIINAADYLDRLDTEDARRLSDNLAAELAAYDDEDAAIERETAEYMAQPRLTDEQVDAMKPLIDAIRGDKTD